MHIRVLAAIRIVGLPIDGEFLGDSAELLLPKALPYDGRNVSEKSFGVGVSRNFGARRRQKNESVTIGLFGAVRWCVIADAPVVPSVVLSRWLFHKNSIP
jgi:hypothetical protein